MKISEKVAIFLPNLDGGGAERAMLNLANGLTEYGISVDLILARLTGPYLPFVSPKIKIVNLGGKGLLRGIPRLVCYLYREQPKILLSAVEPTNIVAFAVTRIPGIKSTLIINIQNTLSVHLPKLTKWKNRALLRLIPLMYPRAENVVAVSQGVADDLVQNIRIKPERVRVIHNSVDLSLLMSQASEKLEHSWFVQTRIPVILSVGRLTPQKNFDLLLKAFVKILSDRPARLMILGEGEERWNLEKIIERYNLQDYVLLPGFMSNPYVYMSHASVFVVSSSWEGLSVVLIEALACGVPVISTDCPSGPSEVLDHGVYGPLVPVGDVDALAEGIKNVLDKPLDKMILQKRGKDFGIDAVCRQYLEFFEQLEQCKE